MVVGLLGLALLLRIAVVVAIHDSYVERTPDGAEHFGVVMDKFGDSNGRVDAKILSL